MQVTLTVIEGPHVGREFSFQEHDCFIVGRAKVAHFRLSVKDKFFSRIHFMVEVNPPLCRLLDMKSTNGTVLNGRRVGKADLKDGDLIKAGKTVIQVSLPAAASDEHDAHPSPAVARFSTAFEHVALSESHPSTSRDRASPMIPPTRVVETARSARAAANDSSCPLCEAPVSGSTVTTEAGLSIQLPLCTTCQLVIQEHPQPIAGYHLVRELGRGGMGVVYLAIRMADQSVVALKTIQPALVGTKQQTERFLREARILSQLDHPQIVTFREVGESNGVFYFAMDYVRGTDAASLQRKLRGPLPIPRALKLTCQMLSALEYAHASGIVHRDIKPANLLVEASGVSDLARLTDFGLARIYQTSPMSGLTLRGDFGGTVAYAAPEQITNFRDAKPPVDQYSAGATLYKLLTNHAVFDLSGSFEKQLLMILQDEPVPIRRRRPEISEKLAAIVHRSLARDPKARFPRIGAFRTALESVLEKL